MVDYEPGESFDYQIDPEVERSFAREITGKGGWSLNLAASLVHTQEGKPELIRVISESGYRPMAVTYELSRCSVRNQRTLEVQDLVPAGWQLRALGLANLRYAAAELIPFIEQYQRLDLDHSRILFGVPEEDSGLLTERWVKELLWNVLVVRAINERGLAGNSEALERQTALIMKRREEVFRALKGKADVEPKELALRPFGSA